MCTKLIKELSTPKYAYKVVELLEDGELHSPYNLSFIWEKRTNVAVPNMLVPYSFNTWNRISKGYDDKKRIFDSALVGAGIFHCCTTLKRALIFKKGMYGYAANKLFKQNERLNHVVIEVKLSDRVFMGISRDVGIKGVDDKAALCGTEAEWDGKVYDIRAEKFITLKAYIAKYRKFDVYKSSTSI
jgi:hypothetical protein